MALLKFDGFDGASVADLTALFGYTIGGSASATTGRFSGSLNAQALSWAGNNTTDYFEIPFGGSKTQFVVGIAFQAANNTALQRVATFRNGATEAFNIVKGTDGKLNIRAGTSTTNLATGTITLTGGQWYYLEIKFNYTGAGNPTVTTRVNGSADVTYSGSLNAQTSLTLVRYGASFSTIICPVTMLLDDFYLLDLSGAQNNDFLGDVRVEMVVPTAESSNTGFAANTGTTPAAVDDATQDGDTTYIHGNADGDIIKFEVGDLSNTPTAIYGVSVQAVAKKTDTGVRSVRTTLTSDGNNVNGSTVTLTTSYAATTPQIAELDPDGNVAWTRAAVEAALIGVEVTD